jgi:uncharacterized protein (TIGR02145 family)
MKKQISSIGIAICLLSSFLISCNKGEVPSITTSEISQITVSSAKGGGTITSEGSATIISRGLCWSVSTNPTIEDNKTSDGAGAGSFSSNISGLNGLTTYFVRAYATNSEGTGYGMSLAFTTLGVKDIEGNFYKTTQIGTQEWMTENLKTTKYKDGTNIPNVPDDILWAALNTGAYCWYNNNLDANKNTYGALYNFYAIETGKLCPSEWHVPTDAEWSILENYLANNGYNYDNSTGFNRYAKALADLTGWFSSQTIGAVGNTDYPEKRNATGFSALPGGVRDANQNIFGSIGNYGMWWTSSSSNETTAWDRGLAADYSSVGRLNVLKTHGFSVRCIKD